jgi:hypothetical protein
LERSSLEFHRVQSPESLGCSKQVSKNALMERAARLI